MTETLFQTDLYSNKISFFRAPWEYEIDRICIQIYIYNYSKNRKCIPKNKNRG